jgi:hypothetical protein
MFLTKELIIPFQKVSTMKTDAAEATAARALEWMAGQEGLIEAFQGATGAGLDDIRAAAASPLFLAAVLDFVMMNDAWVTGFCAADNLTYETFLQARAALPGGDLPHWT